MVYKTFCDSPSPKMDFPILDWTLGELELGWALTLDLGLSITFSSSKCV